LAIKHARFEKATAERAEYERLLAQKRQQARAALLSKKREAKSERKSVKVDKATPAKAATTKAAATKPATKQTTSKPKTTTKP